MQRQKPGLRLGCTIWCTLWKTFPSVPFFLGRLVTVALGSTNALPSGPFGPDGNAFVLAATGPFGPVAASAKSLRMVFLDAPRASAIC